MVGRQCLGHAVAVVQSGMAHPAPRPSVLAQTPGASSGAHDRYASPKGNCMSAARHEPNQDDTDQDAPDLAADAMKDQLRKDVASWREGRSDGSSRQATELSVAVARSIVPPTTAKMKRAKPVATEPKPATSEKKPFGMSYDGTSRADYIKLMISRGAR
jgi:hypothetical protein